MELIVVPPVCPSALVKENAPVLFRLIVSAPEPVVGAETVIAAVVLALSAKPGAPMLSDPVWMVSGLVPLACVMAVTFGPTPPVMVFVPVPVPATPPRTTALLNVMVPKLFTGLVVKEKKLPEDPPPAPLDPFDPDVLHSLRQGFVAQTGTKRRVNLTNRTSRMNGRSSTEEDGD